MDSTSLSGMDTNEFRIPPSRKQEVMYNTNSNTFGRDEWNIPYTL